MSTIFEKPVGEFVGSISSEMICTISTPEHEQRISFGKQSLPDLLHILDQLGCNVIGTKRVGSITMEASGDVHNSVKLVDGTGEYLYFKTSFETMADLRYLLYCIQDVFK